MLRKIILLLTPLLIITILFLLIVLVLNKDNGKGALQITSNPVSQIYLDDKYIGKTPLCLCELPQLMKEGDYNVKLIPVQNGFTTFEQKISIYAGVLTVVDRTFDKQTSASSGSIITLSPIDNKTKSALLLVSFPDKAQVILDSNPKGETPLLINDITASDHEIKLLKDGYQEKTIKVKTTAGKRLEATISLGIKTDLTVTQPSLASSSATLSQVTILDTPTGYLRVRSSPSATASQVGTVNPGEKYDLVTSKSGWYQIKLKDGTLGWVSTTYAKEE